MIDKIYIESTGTDKGFHLCYETTKELSRVCNESGECIIDKSDVREILLSVIKNFNEVNPHYKIEVVP